MAVLEVGLSLATPGDRVTAAALESALAAPGALTTNREEPVEMVEFCELKGDKARLRVRSAAFRMGTFTMSVTLPRVLDGGEAAGSRETHTAHVDVSFPAGPPAQLQLCDASGEPLGSVLAAALSAGSPTVCAALMLRVRDARGDDADVPRLAAVVLTMSRTVDAAPAALLASAGAATARIARAEVEGGEFGPLLLDPAAVADAGAVRGQFKITVECDAHGVRLSASVLVLVNTNVKPKAVADAAAALAAARGELAAATAACSAFAAGAGDVDAEAAAAGREAAVASAAAELAAARGALAAGRPAVFPGGGAPPATTIAGVVVVPDATVARALAAYLGPIALAPVLPEPLPAGAVRTGEWLCGTAGEWPSGGRGERESASLPPLPHPRMIVAGAPHVWSPDAAGCQHAGDAATVQAPAGPVQRVLSRLLGKLALAPSVAAARLHHVNAAAAGWSLLVPGTRTLYDPRGVIMSLPDVGCLGSKCVWRRRVCVPRVCMCTCACVCCCFYCISVTAQQLLLCEFVCACMSFVSVVFVCVCVCMCVCVCVCVCV